MCPIARIVAALISFVLLAGCGCGDTPATRQLQITEYVGWPSGSGPIIVDFAQLPPGSVEKRIERKDACGHPITELRIGANCPIKVVLVPMTQPARSVVLEPVATTTAPSPPRPSELARTEFAMLPGETITATTDSGTVAIHADDRLKRSYSWAGATRSLTTWPRDERWYGSLGVYFPGPGRHWEPHNGITRAVVEEGQQHFSSVEEAIDWVHKREKLESMAYVYTPAGLVVGWKTVPDREQLHVDVWQLLINGKKPVDIPGASSTAIRVTRK